MQQLTPSALDEFCDVHAGRLVEDEVGRKAMNKRQLLKNSIRNGFCGFRTWLAVMKDRLGGALRRSDLEGCRSLQDKQGELRARRDQGAEPDSRDSVQISPD